MNSLLMTKTFNYDVIYSHLVTNNFETRLKMLEEATVLQELSNIEEKSLLHLELARIWSASSSFAGEELVDVEFVGCAGQDSGSRHFGKDAGQAGRRVPCPRVLQELDGDAQQIASRLDWLGGRYAWRQRRRTARAQSDHNQIACYGNCTIDAGSRQFSAFPRTSHVRRGTRRAERFVRSLGIFASSIVDAD